MQHVFDSIGHVAVQRIFTTQSNLYDGAFLQNKFWLEVFLFLAKSMYYQVRRF